MDKSNERPVMRMRLTILAMLLGALPVSVNVSASVAGEATDKTSPAQQGEVSPHDVLGHWRTPDNVLVAINRCEESVCGTVVWFPDLEKPNGIIYDKNNTDETLRTREIKGMPIIYGFDKKKRGWRKGRIYDPESGVEYKSKLTRISQTTLKVQGCVGPVCKTFIWTLDPSAHGSPQSANDRSSQ